METSQITLSFANVSGKKIEADFDGGTTTSDGGVLLLRQAEARTGIVNRLVGAMSDRRHQSYIDHTYTDLIRQRVFQIACGYEDANDSDDLRSDPGLKIACERLPLTGDDLASQPTMSRLENSVTRSDLYRMGEALLETFIESYDKPPKKLILDIDDTDDPTHGSQQLTLFHAYYDEYCYLPIHLYEGETGKLITTLLRPGRRIRGREAAAILKRVLDHLIMVWPKTKITLRGDSHFSTPEVHDLCDGYGIDFILGQRRRQLHQRCAECFELLVIRLSQNEIYVVCVAQVVHLRGAEVRVTTQSDLHLRPGHEYMIQNAFENRRGLAATDSATGSQNGRDQLARPPFVEMDWHVAVLVMVGVEQRELLCTVRGIVRVIDVQDDLPGRLVIGLDECFQ